MTAGRLTHDSREAPDATRRRRDSGHRADVEISEDVWDAESGRLRLRQMADTSYPRVVVD